MDETHERRRSELSRRVEEEELRQGQIRVEYGEPGIAHRLLETRAKYEAGTIDIGDWWVVLAAYQKTGSRP